MGTDNPVLGSRKGGVEVDLSAVHGAVKFAAAERVVHDSALEALWMRHTTIEAYATDFEIQLAFATVFAREKYV